TTRSSSACGSPLWPAIGLVDAMRVGPDVGAHWAARGVGGVEQRSISCLDNTWRAARLRTMFHGALWANDPDCVLLRRRNTKLWASDRIGWARWVANSGQLLMDGDRLDDLAPRDFAFWEQLAATRGDQDASSIGPIIAAKLDA
ncbi:MAG TPA: hypothetical protein VFU90_02145, partial [Candidatus Tumulicola sp.]|nr:hypothetical protein [Candidatus Tumulicola sp.]